MLLAFLGGLAFAGPSGALVNKCPAVASAEDAYAAAYALAKRDQTPLAIFVRCPLRDVPGCVCVRFDDYFDDGDRQAIVVGKPQGGKLEQITLPREATNTEIRRAGGIRDGSSQPLPPAGRCGPGGG